MFCVRFKTEKGEIMTLSQMREEMEKAEEEFANLRQRIEEVKQKGDLSEIQELVCKARNAFKRARDMRGHLRVADPSFF